MGHHGKSRGGRRGKSRGRTHQDVPTSSIQRCASEGDPSSRGIGYIPKARTPSSHRVLVAAMPSAEVAVSVDGVGSTVKDNCRRKKDWKQHASFPHIDDDYIPSSLRRYSTSFISSNMVVVD
mmetsp:Transcript_1127/g.2377  ORF Transcript_1127/g.2377 Transcript_1127/m.2377 type:complete len:122 (+) Transcript_1127:367-732(+)